jgi:hypothetical protein
VSGDLVRVSDAEREHSVASLREHLAQGRLTLGEFTDRMAAAFAATTAGDLAATTHDLPAIGPMRRRPTRFLFSLFSSTTREGRMRIGRRVFCVVGFGNVDLDLREAALRGDVITIVALGAFGAIDVYVPEGVEADPHGLSFFGHKRAHGKDVAPLPGTPLVRMYSFSMFAGIDVWRAAAGQSIRGVIRGQRELEVER